MPGAMEKLPPSPLARRGALQLATTAEGSQGSFAATPMVSPLDVTTARSPGTMAPPIADTNERSATISVRDRATVCSLACSAACSAKGMAAVPGVCASVSFPDSSVVFDAPMPTMLELRPCSRLRARAPSRKRRRAIPPEAIAV